MRKIANIISAYIYIFVVKLFTKQSKEEILEGEDITNFGANLVFSSFVLMILVIFVFYAVIWLFQLFVSFNQKLI